jgi:hypothetical protein
MSKNFKPKNVSPFRLEPVEARERQIFSVKNAAELLEERGLVDPSTVIGQLGKWPIDRVEGVAADLYDYLDQQRVSVARGEISPSNAFQFARERLPAGRLRMLGVQVQGSQAGRPRAIRSNVCRSCFPTGRIDSSLIWQRRAGTARGT